MRRSPIAASGLHPSRAVAVAGRADRLSCRAAAHRDGAGRRPGV